MKNARDIRTTQTNGTLIHYDKSNLLVMVISYYLRNPKVTIDDVAAHFDLKREMVLKYLNEESRIKEVWRGQSGVKMVNYIKYRKLQDPTYLYSGVMKATLIKGGTGIIIEKKKGNSK